MPSSFHFEQWVPYPLEHVFLFFARPANLPRIMPAKLHTRIERLRLTPPSAQIIPVMPSEAEGPCVSHQSLAGVGSEITTSFRVLSWLPFRATWVALITEFEPNRHFVDIQKLGPFHSFHHRHQLRSEMRNSVNGATVTDAIELDLGFGWLGRTIEKLFINRQMQQTFRHRQKVLPRLLAEDYLEGSTKTAVP
jgi:ligand-binding SRPBCC domain-containing protein